MEIPLFFKNESYYLFGVLHKAKKEIKNEARIGIIFCAPFAEEKLISHRVFVNQARMLANNGFYCFRFDYMGHGDSEGKFEDATVETRISDILSAINFFKTEKNISKIILLGLRFGATLTILAQNRIAQIDSLILINPILNGKDYIDQVLRTNLTLQMVTYKKILKTRDQLIEEILAGKPANIDGYLLSKDMYEQMCQISLLENLTVSINKLLIIQISDRDDKPIEKNLQKFSHQIESLVKNSKLINIKENSFWKDEKYYRAKAVNLEQAVLDWLNKMCVR